MRKYRASRFRQLIFPQELIIDKFHVLSRKRHFPAFWRVREESIPLSKLASIQIHRGLFFAKLIIENSGGPYPIIVDGLWNGKACEARDLLETIEREMQRHIDITSIVGEDTEGDPGEDGPDEPSGGSGSSPWWESENNPPKDGPDETERQDTCNAKANVPFRLTESTGSGLPVDEILICEEQDIRDRTGRSEPEVWTVKKDIPATASHERRVGEIPADWKPPAPWEPVKNHEPVKTREEGYPEIDPVEFLNREPEPIPAATAIQEKPKPARSSAVAGLVNWWGSAKTEPDTSSRLKERRRKRKLN